jgi:hypothetical protein
VRTLRALGFTVLWFGILFVGSIDDVDARRPSLTLDGVCQADEDLWVFQARSTRTGTIEITWQQDFTDLFDTVDLRRGRLTTFYTGEPDTGSVTLFARFVDRPSIRTEAELSERPC